MCLGLLIVCFSGTASAITYTLEPDAVDYRDYYEDGNPHDLFDLDHYKAVSWGIDNLGVNLENETITKATLRFDNIRNWRSETNDLYVRLVDNDDSNDLEAGVSSYRDNQAYGDYFEEWGGIQLEHYHNLSSRAQDIEYEFEAAELDELTDYLADGLWGLTFDADCHFWNDGVSLEIETSTDTIPVAAVPEPGTLLLFAMGLFGLIGFRRKFKK